MSYLDVEPPGHLYPGEQNYKFTSVSVEPSVSVNFPAGVARQSVKSVFPVRSLYVPRGQGIFWKAPEGQ